jgi:hypothetical protein
LVRQPRGRLSGFWALLESGACPAEQLPDDLADVAARASEHLVPVALLGQALLPLPARPAVVLQPCRPPPSLDHVAERAVVARVQGLLGRLTQLLLVPLALGGGCARV